MKKEIWFILVIGTISVLLAWQNFRDNNLNIFFPIAITTILAIIICSIIYDYKKNKEEEMAKNRPKFPNGYQKRNKEIKDGANTEEQVAQEPGENQNPTK